MSFAAKPLHMYIPNMHGECLPFANGMVNIDLYAGLSHSMLNLTLHGSHADVCSE